MRPIAVNSCQMLYMLKRTCTKLRTASCRFGPACFVQRSTHPPAHRSFHEMRTTKIVEKLNDIWREETRRDEKRWEEMRRDEKRREEMRRDEKRWSVQCEGWSFKCDLRNAKCRLALHCKMFVCESWPWQQQCSRFAESIQAWAWVAHSPRKFYRWKRSYSIYCITLRQLPPRLVRVLHWYDTVWSFPS